MNDHGSRRFDEESSEERVARLFGEAASHLTSRGNPDEKLVERVLVRGTDHLF